MPTLSPSPADIDPTYGETFDRAINSGVEAIVYGCDVSQAGIDIAGPLPIT